jgi:hypothetical protein
VALNAANTCSSYDKAEDENANQDAEPPVAVPGLCLLCYDSQPFDCLICDTGYILSEESVCESCITGCEFCTSTTNCISCNPGTFRKTVLENGIKTVECSSACDPGYLPFESSMYYMNPDIFTTDEIIAKTIIIEVPAEAQKENIVIPLNVLNAVGIGIYD